MRAADVPPFAFAVSFQNERSLACANQYPYFTHPHSSLPAPRVVPLYGRFDLLKIDMPDEKIMPPRSYFCGGSSRISPRNLMRFPGGPEEHAAFNSLRSLSNLSPPRDEFKGGHSTGSVFAFLPLGFFGRRR